MKRAVVLLSVIVVTLVGFAIANTPVFLPGTQPEKLTIRSSRICSNCHGGYADYSPYDTWRGSMMSHAMRDPLFQAQLAISNRDLEGVIEVGDYCLRCHSPMAWLEGRSEPVDGSIMVEKDLDEGVNCDFCHRLMDPLAEQMETEEEKAVYKYGNAMFVVDSNSAKRGQFNDTFARHDTKYSEFIGKSELCAVCHDIEHPLYNFTPIEKTYSEWKYSAFSREGIECQDCHMPPVEGYASNRQRKFRDQLPKHEFVGGSVWMPEVLIYYYDLEPDVVEALEKTKEKAKEMLRSAAKLEARSNGTKLNVKITNLAGHKLPTGYPEGRRMWLNVKFYDVSGNLKLESGAYDPIEAHLVHDSEIKIYEAKPGTMNISGQPNSPSFHFALNNWIYHDNRIPARGFTNAEYESAKAYIRGASYEDGQYWDITEYRIPSGAKTAKVTLYYQSTTKEYIEFLRDENVGNSWDYFKAGEGIYEAWKKTGKSAPVEMANVTVDIS
ncbi:MAG: multiheme c-type cytochrome [Candidatus Hydrothermarchaeales archaeon]